MKTAEQYAETYDLPVDIVESFLNLKPGLATGVINYIAGNQVAVSKEEIKKQLDLIRSELNEAYGNLEAGNIEGLRDDCMDIVFTGYGLGNRIGSPVDLDYNDVVLSNVCKFDRTPADAFRTQEKYLAVNVVTVIREVKLWGFTYYVTKSAYDQTGIDGKEYPGGKWLKSYKWVDCAYQGKIQTPLVDPEFNVLNLTPQQANELREGDTFREFLDRSELPPATVLIDIDPNDPEPEHTKSVIATELKKMAK